MHKEMGNACMGDGSVQQLTAARLREQLRNTEQTLSEITISAP
jgi:prepilin-type processing-associated H-X9-DG protein